jgi:hypothetical protein
MKLLWSASKRSHLFYLTSPIMAHPWLQITADACLHEMGPGPIWYQFRRKLMTFPPAQENLVSTADVRG